MARKPIVILKNEHKAYLVQRLALFDTPSQAAEAVREEFGLTITPQRAEAYNPDRRAGFKLGEAWRLLFEQTRARFLDKIKKIPETNVEVRVLELARMSRAARSINNFSLAARLFTQIECEMAQVARRVGHHGDVRLMTDKELEAELRRLLGRKMSWSLRRSFVGTDTSMPVRRRRIR
jgi:hypothetical protein